jgi:hypothetical protein
MRAEKYLFATGLYYPTEDWAATLDMYQDGNSNPDNVEAVLYRTNDSLMYLVVRCGDDRNRIPQLRQGFCRLAKSRVSSINGTHVTCSESLSIRSQHS